MNLKNSENYKSLEFHIYSDDYFGTLATILFMLRQRFNDLECKELLEKIEKDLIYLQKIIK